MTNLETAGAIAGAVARRGRPRAHRRRLGARPAAGPRLEGHRPRGVRPAGAAAARRCSRRSAASRPSARAFRSTRSATSTCRCRGASRRPGRGHRGFVVTGDPDMSIDGGRAPARLHRQRDLVGSADRRVLRSVRRPRAISSGACCASSIRDASATTACACCAPCSSPRASTSRSTRRRARSAGRSRSTICPPERDLGRNRKAAARAAAVDRLRARDGARRRREAVSGAAGARRLPAGAGVASRRRRLGAHAAGDRSGAHAHRRSAAAAAARRDARRRLPRSRQAGDDRVHRRPHPIDRSRGAGRRAGDRRCSIG